MIAKSTAEVCRNLIEPILKNQSVERLFQKPGSALHRYRGLLAPRHDAYKSPSPRIWKAGGVSFHLDLSDYMDWKVFFNVGLESAYFLFEQLDEHSVVLDIGANLGFYGLRCANIAKKGRVFCFEPDERCYQKLTTNAGLNQFSNFESHRIALGRETATMSLVRDQSGNSGLNHIAGKTESESINADRLQQVECDSLDAFAIRNNLPRIDVIKVDIEGFETEFLAGAEKTISASRPSILIEVCDNHLRRCDSSATQLIAKLRSLGYRNICDIKTGQPVDDGNLAGCQFDAWCVAR